MEAFFIFWFLLAGGVGWLADSRGRSFFGYFLLSALMSPLLGLIVVLVTRDEVKARELASEQRRQEQMRLEELKALTRAPVGVSAAPVAAASALPAHRPAAPTRACPFCAEDVRAEAVLCKHCKSDISASAVAATAPGVFAPAAGALFKRPAPQSDWVKCPSCQAQMLAGVGRCGTCGARAQGA